MNREVSGRFGGKLLILRFSRLGRTPPALYASQLLNEAGLPVLAVEYGERRELQTLVDGNPPRLRLESPWVSWFPRFAKSPVFLLGTLFQLVGRSLATGRPKIVYAQGINEQLLAWCLRRLLGVPYAVHVHEAFDENELLGFNRWLLKAEGMVLRGAQFLVFPEKERRQIYQDRYRLTAPAFLAFNCPRLLPRVIATDLRQRFGLPQGSFLVGYVGGLGDENVLDEAVEALAKVPQVYFILWGWSDAHIRDRLGAKAAALGVSGRLIFGGELAADKWEALAALDLSYCVYRPVTLRLKHAVTASNKLMESLAVGVPVLTSGESGFVEFLRQRAVGRALSGLSGEAVAQAWKAALSDPDAQRTFGENGRRAHRDDLNYEAQYSEIIKVFSSRFKTD